MNRILKMIIGAALVAYGLYSGNNWFFLGLIPFVMGLCNKCPLGGCKDGACGVDNSSYTTNSTEEKSSCCSNEQTSCCTKDKNQKSKTMSFSTVAPTKQNTQCCSDDTIVIKILGTGCASCITLYNSVNSAIKDLDGKFEVIKVEELEEIMEYQVISTPALVINEVVKSTGKVLNIDEVKALIDGSYENLTSNSKTKCCGN